MPTSSECECGAPPGQMSDSREASAGQSGQEGSPGFPRRPQPEEVPRPKPACNVGGPAGVETPETGRSCAAGVFGRSLPPGASRSSGAARSRSRWPLGALPAPRLPLPGLPNPRPPGPPRRQTATAAADKPVAVDRGGLRRRGGAARTLPRRCGAPARAAPRASPARRTRMRRAGEKGPAAALGAPNLTAPYSRAWIPNGISQSRRRPWKRLPCLCPAHTHGTWCLECVFGSLKREMLLLLGAPHSLPRAQSWASSRVVGTGQPPSLLGPLFW